MTLAFSIAVALLIFIGGLIVLALGPLMFVAGEDDGKPDKDAPSFAQAMTIYVVGIILAFAMLFSGIILIANAESFR